MQLPLIIILRNTLVLLLSLVFLTSYADTAPDLKAGAKIYKEYCSTCHSTGSGGAPRIKDKAKWANRLTKENKVLIQEALNGYKLMPPKGNCYQCSEGDIVNAVAYIRSQVTENSH